MRNSPNMQFKANQYFLWLGDVYKVIVIDNLMFEYKCTPINNPVYDLDTIISFHLSEEKEMTHITKKKYPEYFL